MRAKPKALVIADMPFLTFQVNPEDTLRNAGRLIQEAGVDGVKIEGARSDHVRILVEAGIPVMGHLGLTPQSVLELGGFRVQGRTPEAAQSLLEQAKALEAAGCFSLVLESVPAPVAERVTRAIGIPTIGIGAGRECDGQILVITDLLGMSASTPRFVRRYAELREIIHDAVRRYAEDVRANQFPGPDETYPE